MSRWRAATLIGIHVIMAAHIIQWLIHGMTISPIEPSETMYTLELGQVNAGFVIFSAALLSTLVFGRFFCGWGCHVVALQDLCAHWMNKIGVRPRPFRTRLPLYWALMLALYMFVVPTFKRLVLFPLMDSAHMAKPAWLASVAPFPEHGFKPEFIVQDFWKTFASPTVAVFFLLVCGFATVYFLGSKAFCTYGCPYGGFFAPLDKLSVGRIVVSDSCNGCGHCTSTCTSNVRVHQEVRDFGKVMDPGCMKCMDCVSVCPNDALSFKFSLPAVFTPPRTADAKAGRVQRPPSDLEWWEEIWVFFAGIALFLCLRQFLDKVPLLMAAGMAMIGAFAAWKFTRLLLDPSVRVQSLQLKIKGRWTAYGYAFAIGAVGFLAVSAWSGWVRNTRFRADLLDRAVITPFDTVFSPGYLPTPEQKAPAEKARALYESTLPPSQGGWGWPVTPPTFVRLSWLSAVSGDLAASEDYLRRSFADDMPADDLVFGLERIRSLRGDSPEQLLALYDGLLARFPDHHGARIRSAILLGELGRLDEAVKRAQEVFDGVGMLPNGNHVAQASELLITLQRLDLALAGAKAEQQRQPESAMIRAAFARALYLADRKPEALIELEAATRLEDRNPLFWSMLAELARELGNAPQAEAAEAKVRDLQAKGITEDAK
ncbi:hypothetical protein PHYC_02769 [Phycisphaerales bacterium]|nr:hypothetical protein PHYC_02769 [Phycisphaerales bacterium]